MEADCWQVTFIRLNCHRGASPLCCAFERLLGRTSSKSASPIAGNYEQILQVGLVGRQLHRVPVPHLDEAGADTAFGHRYEELCVTVCDQRTNARRQISS